MRPAERWGGRAAEYNDDIGGRRERVRERNVRGGWTDGRTETTASCRTTDGHGRDGGGRDA